MLFSMLLVVASVAAWMLPERFGGRSLKEAAARGMAVALFLTGLSHFAMPAAFAVYFPDWVPFQTGIVIATGIVEVVSGLALLIRKYRPQVGLALVIYLVLVFPGNVYAAVAGSGEGLPGLPDAPWYPWVRLPFQALFIWWVWWSTREEAPVTLDAVRSVG